MYEFSFANGLANVFLGGTSVLASLRPPLKTVLSLNFADFCELLRLRQRLTAQFRSCFFRLRNFFATAHLAKHNNRKVAELTGRSIEDVSAPLAAKH